MQVPTHPTLIRNMLQARLKKLAGKSPILAASFVSVQRRCGNKSCHCHKGGPKHSAQQVTLRHQGKTRSVYVPKDLVGEVRAWIAEHKRIKQLLREINQLTLALIRSHAQERKRKAGRP